MKKLSLFLSIFVLLFLSACSEPALSGKTVKNEYFTGGQIRSKFIMDDKSGQNGTLHQYGYDGHVVSTVSIRNGVNHGVETIYDEKGRVAWKIVYDNGKKTTREGYYPNGDPLVSYTYKNGILDGPAQTYNKDGSIDRRIIYKNGRIDN